MELDKLNKWLLLVSNLAIVGGLVLVALQINQDMKLAKVEMFMDVSSSRIAQQLVMMGENPAPVVTKSLIAPKSLTLDELRVMDSYLVSAVNEIRRTEVLSREDLGIDDASFENILLIYFGNEFGKAW